MVQINDMKNLKTETLLMVLSSVFLIIFALSTFAQNMEVRAMDSDISDIEEVIDSEISEDEKIVESLKAENTKSDAGTEKKDEQIQEVQIEKVEEEVEEIPTESDSETYTAKDFSFEYPKNWFINEVQSEFNSYVQIFNYDDSKVKGSHYISKEHFKIEIVKLENTDNLSLRDWVDTFIENQDYETEVLEERIIEVDDREAIYQIENIVPMGIIHPGVFIKKGNDIFIMNVNQLKGYEAVLDGILESFKFNE